MNAVASLKGDREPSTNENASINTTNSETTQANTEALYERALVADATLAKVLAAPPEVYTAGFLSDIANTVAKIAPTVLNGIGDVLSVIKGPEP